MERIEQPALINLDEARQERHNGVERINGIKLSLGRLSLSELREIEQHCVVRLENAQTDLMIVRDYIDLAADGGGAA